MAKLFVIVLSLWGFDGSEWVYVGNQVVYQEPMSYDECIEAKDKWIKFEQNEYYRLSIECKNL